LGACGRGGIGCRQAAGHSESRRRLPLAAIVGPLDVPAIDGRLPSGARSWSETTGHDVTPGSSGGDLFKPSCREVRDKPHESIAGRLGVHRVGLDDNRAAPVRMVDSGSEKLPEYARSPNRSAHEEADDRPHGALRDAIIDEPSESTVGRTRCNRAPRDRLAIPIREKTYSYFIQDPAPKRLLPTRSVCPSCFLGSRPPDHAPAALRSTPRLEQAHQIGPQVLVDGPNSECGSACHGDESSPRPAAHQECRKQQSACPPPRYETCRSGSSSARTPWLSHSRSPEVTSGWLRWPKLWQKFGWSRGHNEGRTRRAVGLR
jgi:hypothetical protein